MQELPPYTLAEIRVRLFQYLDNELEPAQMLELDNLMAQHPSYRREFLKLQATHTAIQSAYGVHCALPGMPEANNTFWANIAPQLQAAVQQEPEPCDFEFVSAYHDGEISRHDAQLLAFEAQLYGNAEANHILGGLHSLSEAIRQYGVNAETHCSLDITQQVMTAFAQEQNPALMDSSSAVDLPMQAANGSAEEMERLALSAEFEMLSAYADQALSPRETIEANRLIENEQQARETLQGLTRLSESIQGMGERLQAQAPDLWPQLAPLLNRPLAAGGVLVPFSASQRVLRGLKVVGPIAAALFLVWISLPSGSWMTLNVASAPQRGIRLAQIVNPPHKGQRTQSTELASLPMGMVNPERAAGMVLGGDQQVDAQADLLSVDRQPRHATAVRIPTHPILEPQAAKLAAHPSGSAGVDTALEARATAPSSEEYLFNALNEQMPNEDISNILGN